MGNNKNFFIDDVVIDGKTQEVYLCAAKESVGYKKAVLCVGFRFEKTADHPFRKGGGTVSGLSLMIGY